MATKYSDIINIRSTRTAYNIIDEEQGAWMDFIANEQFNDILRTVISSVRNNDADLHRSFWISGTYGTGKSHAGAVIKHLLCDPKETIVKFVNDEYQGKKYDMLRGDILALRDSKRLFPVMLYGQEGIAHTGDLALRMQAAVKQALKEAGVKVNVKTDFESYVDHIEKEPEVWQLLISKSKELQSVAPTLEKLKKDLKDCDTGLLEMVLDAQRATRISIPMEESKLSRWIFEVQNELRQQGIADGLLIIWDEFTNVMNSPIGPSILVALQEVAEQSMNKNNDTYLFFISHPSALNSLAAEERTKTKGRYHYMAYNMEPVSAFRIMTRKFTLAEGATKEQWSSLLKEFFVKNPKNNELINGYAAQSSLPKETAADIMKLYPLHPGTANLATYYAREAGSSSRSVFQFVGDNPAIRAFFDNEEYYATRETITADYLWDYVVGELQANPQRFGAVTERFNNRSKEVAKQGADYLAVFKGILLLNALNNIANNETVTPSLTNIRNLFTSTSIEPELNTILDYFDQNSIIQRQPGDIYSIQFSALPPKEIEEMKQSLMAKQFKYTSQVVNFSSKVTNMFDTLFFAQVNRPYQWGVFSDDANDHTLKMQIQKGRENTPAYKIFLALMMGRNQQEVTHLREVAQEASGKDGFKEVVFVVFDTPMGDKEYDRFIENMANALCAQKHNLQEQQNTHTENAVKQVSAWVTNVRKGNFNHFLQGVASAAATMRITPIINKAVAPQLYPKGPESLPLILEKSAKTYWQNVSAAKAVQNILNFDTKKDICAKCNGQMMHIPYLLQDSVDENLKFVADIDDGHPLLLVQQYVTKALNKAKKEDSFNLGEILRGLSQPPYGLYSTYSGMGMVAFALRKYVNQIFDMNGQPRNQQHLADAVVEMFKAWDKGTVSGKLQFRFETDEARQVCADLINIFHLNQLPTHHDIGSITDARWAITHEYAKKAGFPLWSLKYVEDKPVMAELIDNIILLCGPSDTRNAAHMAKVCAGIEANRLELSALVNGKSHHSTGFSNFLKHIEVVNYQDSDFDEVWNYLKGHLQDTIGLWTEEEVTEQVRNWHSQKTMEKLRSTKLQLIDKIDNLSDLEPYMKDDDSVVRDAVMERADILKRLTPPVPITHTVPLSNQKRLKAKERIRQLDSIEKARKILERICECEDLTDQIWDIING